MIRPAILWNDGRSTKETDYLNEVIGKERLSEYIANIAFTGFTAPKILWMKENEPDQSQESEKLCCQKIIWLTACLGCFAATIQMHPECCFLM